MQYGYIKIILLFTSFFTISLFGQKVYTIKISDNKGFEPKNIKINLGDKVIWQLVSGFHTTTSDDQKTPEAWDANLNLFNSSFEKIFNLAGKFKYHCKFHKKHTGQIEVFDPVPVELTYFKSEFINNYVLIEWQTATETNNLGFEIERKKDNSDWVLIASIEGNGTSSIIHSYSYSDKEIPGAGKYFYRLKQIDLDGTYKYYDEKEVDVNNFGTIVLFQNYPNPFNPVTTIRYLIQERKLVQIRVFSVLGNEIAVLVNEQKDPGYYEIKFNGSNLSSGVYYLQMKTDNYDNIVKMALIH